MKKVKSLSEFVEWVRTAQDGDREAIEGLKGMLPVVWPYPVNPYWPPYITWSSSGTSDTGGTVKKDGGE